MTAIKHGEYFSHKKEDILKSGMLPEEVISFYQVLFENHDKYLEKITSLDLNYDFIDINNHPSVDINAISFTESMKNILKDTLTGVINAIKIFQPDLQLDHLVKDYNANIASFEDALKNFLSNAFDPLKDTATKLKIDTDELIFILNNWFKPLFVSMQKKYMSEKKLKDWHEAQCPFCGYLPDINKIVESKDNKRILHCGLCEYEWQFKRLTCTVCGNEDSETLGFYVFEDDETYRFDYFDECKFYIKTLKIPKKFEDARYDLAVENIITSFLDASAIDMGYKKP